MAATRDTTNSAGILAGPHSRRDPQTVAWVRVAVAIWLLVLAGGVVGPGAPGGRGPAGPGGPALVPPPPVFRRGPAPPQKPGPPGGRDPAGAPSCTPGQ